MPAAIDLSADRANPVADSEELSSLPLKQRS